MTPKKPDNTARFEEAVQQYNRAARLETLARTEGARAAGNATVLLQLRVLTRAHGGRARGVALRPPSARFWCGCGGRSPCRDDSARVRGYGSGRARGSSPAPEGHRSCLHSVGATAGTIKDRSLPLWPVDARVGRLDRGGAEQEVPPSRHHGGCPPALALGAAVRASAAKVNPLLGWSGFPTCSDARLPRHEGRAR